METEVLLKDYLLEEHSKKQCLRIVAFIGTDKRKFAALIRLLLQGNYRVVQRAAWPLTVLAEEKPTWFKPYIKLLLPLLSDTGVHNAVRRNIARIIQFIEVPVNYHGRLMDDCFRLIASPDEPVAIKAFCLTILDNLSTTYPEIVPELVSVIDERWPHETAAFKSRGRKIKARCC